jgi:hypothetical protein
MRFLRLMATRSSALLLPGAHLVELADCDPLLLNHYFLLHHRYLLHLCAPSGRPAAGLSERQHQLAHVGTKPQPATHRPTHSQEAEAEEDQEQLCVERSTRVAVGRHHRRRGSERTGSVTRTSKHRSRRGSRTLSSVMSAGGPYSGLASSPASTSSALSVGGTTASPPLTSASLASPLPAAAGSAAGAACDIRSGLAKRHAVKLGKRATK